MCGLGLGPKPRLGLGLEGPTAWVMVRLSPSRQGGLGLGSAQAGPRLFGAYLQLLYNLVYTCEWASEIILDTLKEVRDMIIIS
jgi:hypothetical protein